jgi:hypothetical protein
LDENRFDRLTEHAPKISALLFAEKHYLMKKEELAQCAAQLSQLEARFHDSCSPLLDLVGTDEISLLARFIDVRVQLVTFAHQIADLTQSYDEAVAEHKWLFAQYEEWQRSGKTDVQGKRLPFADELAETEMLAAQNLVEVQRQDERALHAAREQYRELCDAITKALPSRRWFSACLIFAFLSVALSVIFFLNDEVAFALLFFAFACASGFASVKLGRGGRTLDRLKQRLAELTRQMAECEARVSQRQEEISYYLNRLGVSGEGVQSDADDVTRLYVALEKIKERASERQTRNQAMREALSQKEQAQEKLMQALKEAKARFREYLLSNGLPVIDPLIVHKVLWHVEMAVERYEQLTLCRKRYKALAEEVSRFEGDLSSLLRQLGLIPQNPADDLRRLAELFAKFEEKRSAVQSLADVEHSLATLQKKEAEWEHEWRKLLMQGGATDAQQFLLREKQYRKRIELQGELEKLKQVILHAGGEQGEAFFSALAENERETLENALAMRKNLLLQKEKAYEQLLHEKGELVKEQQALVDEDALGKVRQKMAQRTDELMAYVRQWAAYAICLQALNMTLDEYENEKQPAVVKRASAYFCMMTQNRYRRIIAALEQKTLEVERFDGRRLDAGYLSRGTLEQLLLAMRLALVEAFAKQVRLPFIIDDIFVNFDAVRLKQTAAVLCSFAQNQQVILLTCHRHIVEQFRELAPAAHFFQLAQLAPISQMEGRG